MLDVWQGVGEIFSDRWRKELYRKERKGFAKVAKKTLTRKSGPISGATFSKEAGQEGVRKGDARDRSGKRVGS